MKALIAFAVLTAFVAAYVVWIRPWLRTKDWAAGYFAKVDKIELLLFQKSESILWARFLQAVGLVVPALQIIGAIDITPYLAIIPTEYVPYLTLLIFLAGRIGEALRKDTTKPLELVAVPENPPPEVASAVAGVEGVNERAVAVVEAAKEQGAV